jgi:hypothetical protein
MTMKPGTIVGIAALLGLLAILATLVFLKLHPPAQRPPQGDYDQVFKYCTDIFVRNDAELASLRSGALYQSVLALKPGEYEAGDGGHLYLLGGGMFEIRLPLQLQVVRSFGSVPVTSATDRPREVIGCTPEHLAKTLGVYGLQVKPETIQPLQNASPYPAARKP